MRSTLCVDQVGGFRHIKGVGTVTVTEQRASELIIEQLFDYPPGTTIRVGEHDFVFVAIHRPVVAWMHFAPTFFTLTV